MNTALDLRSLFITHFIFTMYMVGAIWIIQIIHYPLFAFVGKAYFSTYEQLHIQRTSIVIALPMIVELITLFLLLYLSPVYLKNPWIITSAAMLIVIWLTTFFISVPQHNILSGGFDEAAHQKLVLTNWIRTAFWTIRGGCLVKVLFDMIRP